MTTGLDVVDEAVPLLRTRAFGRWMQAHQQVGSTNSLAADWAAAGTPEGSVVFAEHQTMGRGRMGRSWTATAGLNLTFSVVLRPRLLADQWSLITVAAGLAVATAVEHVTSPQRPLIKWPNDILLEEKKCCGMLLESVDAGVATKPGTKALILGVGLNVNQASFEPELSERATSLLLETGRFTHRPTLLADLLLQLEHFYDVLQEGGAESLRRSYVARLHRLGQEATYRVTDDRNEITGTVEGVTDTGALRLRTKEGLQVFHAGELTTAMSGR